MSAPLVPSLIGPTGSGKTALALEIARRIDLEIVSADSRQVYREIDIGTAKPSVSERAAVPHHLVDVVDPHETYSAARFGREARAACQEITARGRVPLLVGGSGLYLRAAERGIFEGPEADADLRARLRREADEHGGNWLHGRLAVVDAESAKRLHRNDRVRLIRALEVYELTGTTLSEHHRRHREALPPVASLRFGISWPTVTLDRRIRARVDVMLAAGWADEVRRLLDRGLSGTPALDALGYPEVQAWVEGRLSREEARDRIVLATRQFAKRQRTWFRAVRDVTWLEIVSREELVGKAEGVAQRIEQEVRAHSG